MKLLKPIFIFVNNLLGLHIFICLQILLDRHPISYKTDGLPFVYLCLIYFFILVLEIWLLIPDNKKNEKEQKALPCTTQSNKFFIIANTQVAVILLLICIILSRFAF